MPDVKTNALMPKGDKNGRLAIAPARRRGSPAAPRAYCAPRS